MQLVTTQQRNLQKISSRSSLLEKEMDGGTGRETGIQVQKASPQNKVQTSKSTASGGRSCRNIFVSEPGSFSQLRTTRCLRCERFSRGWDLLHPESTVPAYLSFAPLRFLQGGEISKSKHLKNCPEFSMLVLSQKVNSSGKFGSILFGWFWISHNKMFLVFKGVFQNALFFSFDNGLL